MVAGGSMAVGSDSRLWLDRQCHGHGVNGKAYGPSVAVLFTLREAMTGKVWAVWADGAEIRVGQQRKRGYVFQPDDLVGGPEVFRHLRPDTEVAFDTDGKNSHRAVNVRLVMPAVALEGSAA